MYVLFILATLLVPQSSIMHMLSFTNYIAMQLIVTSLIKNNIFFQNPETADRNTSLIIVIACCRQLCLSTVVPQYSEQKAMQQLAYSLYLRSSV
jgi:hypothetical protein